MRKNFVSFLVICILSLIGGGKELSAQVAKVGSTTYATIDEAITNWTNGTTLTLLADVTLNDVITLKSTEHHILDLSTFTMTAASGQNAIEILAYGNGGAERPAITINADATNPGGINAGTKSVVYYSYDATTYTSGEDRPIIKVTGGVFYGGTATFGTNSGFYAKGTAAKKAATFQFEGGIFNCSINGTGKNKLIITGGVFNYGVYSQGDSTANRLIYGGKFKSSISGTMDSKNTKFWIGTSMGNSNVGVYVDDESYLNIGGPVITNFDVNKNLTCYSTAYTRWGSYLEYSSAKNYGLYYTSIKIALDKSKNYSADIINIHRGTLDLTSETTKYTFKGKINLPNKDSEFTVKFKTSLGIEFQQGVTTDNPDNLPVVSTETIEGNITTRRYFLKGEDPVCRIDDKNYNTFIDAYNAAINGNTITFLKDSEGEGVTISKNINIDFQNYSYLNSTKFIVSQGYTVSLLNGTINDIENSGTLTLENLTLGNAEYVLISKGTTYLNSTCRVNGYVEYSGGELYNGVYVSGVAKKSFTGIGESQSTTGWSSISTPMAEAKIPEATAGIHDLYRYNETEQLWEYYSTEVDESQGVVSNPFDKLSLGHGYLYTNKENITFELSGDFNIDDVTLQNLSYTAGNKLAGFHMIGNPFTHSITGNDFQTSATLSNGFYVMQSNGAWAAQTLGTSIDPMSSVLIKLDGKADLTIVNSKRRSDIEDKGHIAIKASKGGDYDVAYVSFNEGIGLDKISHRNEKLPMLYIPIENTDYAIATMSEDVTEIPVSFKAPQLGEYTIDVEPQNCEFSTMVLIDNLTGNKTDLLLEDYTFVARANDIANRFKISFTRKGDISKDDKNFTYINNGQMIFDNVEGSALVNIYDVMGRHIAGHSISGASSIATVDFAKGMYIVQMSDENGVKVQKVIID